MQKIIGLDVGSYSVKAVEVLNHFNSFEISNYYEKVIPNIDGLTKDQLVPICLEQLFIENKIEADRIITAMPGQYSSSRILSFNFSDARKIESAVFAEIEDTVPYNLDEMILDHQIIGTSAGQTHVLVVLTKKEFVASFLNHLLCVDIDPKVVDIDSLSLYNLLPYLNQINPDKCSAIIDVGHEKTSVCIVQGGFLKMFRSINIGGRYVTDFLARDLSVSYHEAQRIKHRVSTVITNKPGSTQGLSSEDIFVAERMTLALSSLMRELGRTLYAFKNWDKAPLDKIYLSGGTSDIKNFDVYVSENLGPEALRSEFDVSKLKITESLDSKKSLLTQGLGISLRAVASAKKVSQINLRKGEFAFVQDYGAIFKSSNRVLKYASIIFLALSVTYGGKYFLFSKEIEKVQASYKAEFLKRFPDYNSRLDKSGGDFSKIHSTALNLIKTNTESLRSTVDSFSAADSESSALKSLYDISSALSADIKVDVTEYYFLLDNPSGSGRLQLRVEAENFEILDQFKKAMASIKNFSEFVEKSSDKKPGSNLKVGKYEVVYKKNEI
jgi:general secretion pathway protein L